MHFILWATRSAWSFSIRIVYKEKLNANQIYIENRTSWNGHAANWIWMVTKDRCCFSGAIVENRKRTNVSMGQRKTRLFLDTFAICRFPDDCTYKCIVTVVSLFFLFCFHWTRVYSSTSRKIWKTMVDIFRYKSSAKSMIFFIFIRQKKIEPEVLKKNWENALISLEVHWNLFVELYT